MLLLVAFQVLVLNHLQIMGYGTPLIFVVLLLYILLLHNHQFKEMIIF